MGEAEDTGGGRWGGAPSGCPRVKGGFLIPGSSCVLSSENRARHTVHTQCTLAEQMNKVPSELDPKAEWESARQSAGREPSRQGEQR